MMAVDVGAAANSRVSRDGHSLLSGQIKVDWKARLACKPLHTNMFMFSS